MEEVKNNKRNSKNNILRMIISDIKSRPGGDFFIETQKMDDNFDEMITKWSRIINKSI